MYLGQHTSVSGSPLSSPLLYLPAPQFLKWIHSSHELGEQEDMSQEDEVIRNAWKSWKDVGPRTKLKYIHSGLTGTTVWQIRSWISH